MAITVSLMMPAPLPVGPACDAEQKNTLPRGERHDVRCRALMSLAAERALCAIVGSGTGARVGGYTRSIEARASKAVVTNWRRGRKYHGRSRSL